MNFIKLPSGVVVNTDHIIFVKQSEHEGQIQLVLTDERTPWLESMSIEDFQNLLRGPAVTPMVSFTVDLDKLKPGEPCQFTHENGVKHGLIERLEVTDYGDIAIRITSDGEPYTVIPPQ
jgi:hypothetical protein